MRDLFGLNSLLNNRLERFLGRASYLLSKNKLLTVCWGRGRGRGQCNRQPRKKRASIYIYIYETRVLQLGKPLMSTRLTFLLRSLRFRRSGRVSHQVLFQDGAHVAGQKPGARSLLNNPLPPGRQSFKILPGLPRTSPWAAPPLPVRPCWHPGKAKGSLPSVRSPCRRQPLTPPWRYCWLCTSALA